MSFPASVEGKTQGLYDQSSSPSHMLGTAMRLADGRSYRYAKAGGNITIGRVVGHVAIAYPPGRDCVPSTATPRTTEEWDEGTRTIHVATTASATTSLHLYANRFDDGYLWVNDRDGEGQIFQIKSHEVSGTAADADVALTMYDEELLTVALTVNTQIALQANIYKDVVVHTGTTSSGPALGVANRAVTSGKYFWLQTWGPTPVLTGAVSLVAGQEAVVGNTTGGDTGLAFTAGSAYPITSTKLHNSDLQRILAPRIGWTVVPATTTGEYALVFLTCAP